MVKTGFLYCFRAECYPENVFKCGRTVNLQERKLNLLTSIPTDGEFIYIVEVPDTTRGEKRLFELLKTYKQDKEFFKCDILEIVFKMREVRKEMCPIDKGPKKSYSCNECDYSTNIKTNLTRHQKKHSLKL